MNRVLLVVVLLTATTARGRGGEVVEALPVGAVPDTLRRHGALAPADGPGGRP